MNILLENYIQTFAELKERIKQAQYKSIAAVNSEMILAYLDIGKTISEKTKQGWGNSIIDKLSIDLQTEFKGIKGFSIIKSDINISGFTGLIFLNDINLFFFVNLVRNLNKPIQ